MSDVSSFISDLKGITDNNLIDIIVPSLDKKYKFKPLTVKQQKDCLKASLSGPQGAIAFFNVLNDIIKSNCEQQIEFTLLDRVHIILSLRNHSLGNTYRKGGKTYDLTLSYKKPTSLTINSLEYNGINVELRVPTLAIDTLINTRCIQEIQNKQAKEVSEIVDVLYAYEIMKYLKTVELNGVTVEYDTLPLKDKKALIDVLPLSLNKEILKSIASVKAYDDNYLIVDGDELTLDVSLLTND